MILNSVSQFKPLVGGCQAVSTEPTGRPTTTAAATFAGCFSGNQTTRHSPVDPEPFPMNLQ